MSIYGPRTGRRRQQGIYSVPAPSGRRKEDSGGLLHGVGGFVQNFAEDIRDAAVGLPTGLVMTARHPVRSLEQIGKSTWHDWSPLFHGEVGKWARQVYAHPLAPILDVASVATLGAGSIAKGGSALSKAGVVSKDSRLAKLGQPRDVAVEGPQGTFYRHLSKNPTIRAREQATHALGKKLASAMPSWFGRIEEAGGGPVKTGRIADLSPEGEYAKLELKDRAKRGIAADHIKASMHLQVAKFLDGGRMAKHDPNAFFQVAEQGLRDGLDAFARPVKADHLKSVGKGDKARLVAPKGMRFVNATRGKSPRIATEADLEAHIKSFAPRNTKKKIKDPADALRDAEGNYLLVPDHTVNMLVEETASSSKLMKMLYDKPTRAWKWAVLATRPAFVVNNVVGNVMMTMAALGPGAFARGLVDATRNLHGDEAAVRLSKDMDRMASKATGRSGNAIDRWYMAAHQEGFGYEAKKALSLGHKIGGKKGRVVTVFEQGLFPITHKYAERGLRKAGIAAYLRQAPEVRALMKEGRSFDEAVDIASRNPGLRSRVEEQMNDVLGQYHYLSRTEQSIRKLVPFYTWDRAISRHVAHMAKDRPTRTAALARIGYQGTEETEETLGDIPRFMKGLLPLGEGRDGRTSVLSTQGLNPYSTVPDVVDTIRGLTVGQVKPSEVAASQLNPIVTGFIESTTGQSLLSGARLPEGRGGVAQRTATNVVEALPQIKLLKTVFGGEEQPKPHKRTGKVTNFLYRKDARAQIAAFLGVPVKELDRARAADLARKELGVKKPRRRKQSGIYG